MNRIVIVLLGAAVGLVTGMTVGRPGNPTAAVADGGTHEEQRNGHPSSTTATHQAKGELPALSVFLQRVASIPAEVKTELRPEIIDSEREPEEARELRHQQQLDDLRSRRIVLSHEEETRYLQISDEASGLGRLERAQFLLGEVTEQQYIESQVDLLRQSFKAFHNSLNDDDFEHIFNRRPDLDPFDPNGAIPQPQLEASARETMDPSEKARLALQLSEPEK